MQGVLFIAITAMLTLTQSTVINRSRSDIIVFPGETNADSVNRFDGGRGDEGTVPEGFGGSDWWAHVRGQLSSTKQPQIEQLKPNADDSQSSAYLRCFVNCPTTNEYNPVCGTDNQTYQNRQRMSCAQNCGLNVQVLNIGACQSAPIRERQRQRELMAEQQRQTILSNS